MKDGIWFWIGATACCLFLFLTAMYMLGSVYTGRAYP